MVKTNKTSAMGNAKAKIVAGVSAAALAASLVPAAALSATSAWADEETTNASGAGATDQTETPETAPSAPAGTPSTAPGGNTEITEDGTQPEETTDAENPEGTEAQDDADADTTPVGDLTRGGGNAGNPVVVQTGTPSGSLTATSAWYANGEWQQRGSSWAYTMTKYTTQASESGGFAAVPATTKTFASGFTKIGDDIYYFDPTSHNMLTGWQKIGLDSPAYGHAGWAWYYFMPKTGKMVTGEWILYRGEWYYMLADGDSIFTNYMKAFAASKSGQANNGGFRTIDVENNKYTSYLGQMNMATAVASLEASEAGTAADDTTGTTDSTAQTTYTVKDIRFFNTKNGAMAKNYMMLDEKYIPAMWICDDGETLLGKAGDTWIMDGSSWYLARPQIMAGTTLNSLPSVIATPNAAGEKSSMVLVANIDGESYVFNKLGVMQTGWLNLGSSASPKWYFCNSDGAVVTSSWIEYQDAWYWMGADGVMATDSYVDNDRYYVGKDGAWEPDHAGMTNEATSQVYSHPLAGLIN